MRPTRRGVAVLTATVAAVVLGALYGARSLNAVAVPGIVALVAAVVQVWRVDAPAVTRERPRPGFPGEIRTVRLTIATNGPCTVRDRIAPGLRRIAEGEGRPGRGGGGSGRGGRSGRNEGGTDFVGALAGSTTVAYDVELEERGERTLGPVTVVVRDVLGLVTRAVQVDERAGVLVYPGVHDVTDRRAFAGLVDRTPAPGRDAFDRLREYTPGDALRDVDWKASARRADEEFVVTEYRASEDDPITVVAETETGDVDAMAAATASVALYLLESSLAVEVVLSGARVEAGTGTVSQQRDAILSALARVGTGTVDDHDRSRADVYVTTADADADGSGAVVRVAGRPLPFEALVDRSRSHEAAGVTGA